MDSTDAKTVKDLESGPVVGSAQGSSATEPPVAETSRAEPPPVQSSQAPQVDRVAAFAAGAGRIPRKTIVIFAVSLVVLGIGGAVVDHFFGGAGGSSTTATTAGAYPPPLGTSTNTTTATTGTRGANAGSRSSSSALTPDSPQLPSSPAALMGLSMLTPRVAPGIALTDQHGTRVTLAGLRGKVVVLSFFDAACDDICPVLASELSQAYRDLGSDASRVTLLTVNTDPLELAAASAAPAAAATGSPSPPDWQFLTGSLRQLDSVWKSYGVTIEVQRETRRVSHNDVLYFVDPSGRLRLRATPFADESTAGVFSLSSAVESAWATGIADQARALLQDES